MPQSDRHKGREADAALRRDLREAMAGAELHRRNRPQLRGEYLGNGRYRLEYDGQVQDVRL